MATPRKPSAPTIHECPSLPREGISIYFDPSSTLLRSEPTWRLDIQREATEADLEENLYLEEIGEIIWTTSLEISHCPYCGTRLPLPDCEIPNDFGQFTHCDMSGWHLRHM